jgi:hypothetical protein
MLKNLHFLTQYAERGGLLPSVVSSSLRRRFKPPEPSSIKECSPLMRREGDSNPRNPFEVHTLSRRAS